MVQRSAQRNDSRGVTGLLLHGSGFFYQILEGEDPVIDPLFARIELDSRHDGVLVLGRSPISSRLFPRWSMRGVDLDRDLARPDADRLRALLCACRDDPGARPACAAEIETRILRLLVQNS
jgi:hypothetical protein